MSNPKKERREIWVIKKPLDTSFGGLEPRKSIEENNQR
jgi:hypothetical protein